MMGKRSCENCGNEKCKSMIVAIYYDVCVKTNYSAFWMPKTEGEDINVPTREDGE